MFPRLRVAILLLAGMIFALTIAETLRPKLVVAEHEAKFDLENGIPRSFGEWAVAPDVLSSVTTPSARETLNRIYSQTLSRMYVNGAGDRVMLALAYGSEQSDELKAHRPEVCYPAQGFEVLQQTRGHITLDSKIIPVTRIVASAGSRIEPVTYWLAVGGMAAATDFERKLVQLRFGLTGKIPDGMLVRVSTIEADADHAYKVHEQFARDLVSALPPEVQGRIGVAGF